MINKPTPTNVSVNENNQTAGRANGSNLLSPVASPLSPVSPDISSAQNRLGLFAADSSVENWNVNSDGETDIDRMSRQEIVDELRNLRKSKKQSSIRRDPGQKYSARRSLRRTFFEIAKAQKAVSIKLPGNPEAIHELQDDLGIPLLEMADTTAQSLLRDTTVLAMERTFLGMLQLGYVVFFLGSGLMMVGARDTNLPHGFGVVSCVAAIIYCTLSWFIHYFRMKCLREGRPLGSWFSGFWTGFTTFLLVAAAAAELAYGIQYPYLVRGKVVEIPGLEELLAGNDNPVITTLRAI